MTWEELSAAIAEKVTAAKTAVKTDGLSEADRRKATNEAVAAELANLPHEVRQFLHDGGHQMATAQGAQKLRAAEEARTALETAKADLEAQVQQHLAKIAEIEGKTPDVEAVKRKMQEDFQKIEDSLKAKVTEAEAKAAELAEARKADRVDSFVSRLHGRIGTAVTEDGAEWAQNRIERMKLDRRFTPRDEEGSPFAVDVRRPDSQDMVYHANTEDELLGVVAAEVLEGAPKWAIRSGVKGGGGAGSNGSAGVNRWDKIRETAQARGKQPEQDAINKRRTALLGDS